MLLRWKRGNDFKCILTLDDCAVNGLKVHILAAFTFGFGALQGIL